MSRVWTEEQKEALREKLRAKKAKTYTITEKDGFKHLSGYIMVPPVEIVVPEMGYEAVLVQASQQGIRK